MTKGKYGILDTSYLSKRHKEYILKENKKKDDLIEITYANLKTLRDTNSLQQGKWYKIIDYVATTTQEGTKSANHPFDIIVRADSSSILNENAFAAIHEGDNYFSKYGCKLEAWKLKYCLDNDQNRFYWAQEEGKGVIYNMIDEWENEAPFDFKNIMFLRDTEFFNDHPDWAASVLNYYSDDDLWFYYLSTCNSSKNYEVEDLSIIGQFLKDDEGICKECYNNKLKSTTTISDVYDIFDVDLDKFSKICFVLPNTIIVEGIHYEHTIEDYNEFYGVYNNIISGKCYNNSINISLGNNNIICETFYGNILNRIESNFIHCNYFSNNYGVGLFANNLICCRNCSDNNFVNNVEQFVNNIIKQDGFNTNNFNKTISASEFDGKSFYSNNVKCSMISCNFKGEDFGRNTIWSTGDSGKGLIHNIIFYGNIKDEDFNVPDNFPDTKTIFVALNSSGTIKIWNPADSNQT